METGDEDLGTTKKTMDPSLCSRLRHIAGDTFTASTYSSVADVHAKQVLVQSQSPAVLAMEYSRCVAAMSTSSHDVGHAEKRYLIIQEVRTRLPTVLGLRVRESER